MLLGRQSRFLALGYVLAQANLGRAACKNNFILGSDRSSATCGQATTKTLTFQLLFGLQFGNLQITKSTCRIMG